MRRVQVLFFGMMAIVGLAANASAAPIVGTLTLSGGSVLFDSGAAALGDETLDFTPLGVGGGFLSVITSNGYFTGMASTIPGGPFYGGKTLDLSNDATPPAGAAFAPPGVLISVPDFLSDFDAPGFEPITGNDLSFELLFMPLSAAPACTGAEAVGDSCSVAGSQFTLTRELTGTGVSFTVIGLFKANAGADEGLGTGIYTASILGLTPFDIVSRILAGLDVGIGPNQDEPFGWDANFRSIDNTVPEPATLLTFGIGAAFLAIRRRRRAVK